MSGALHVLPHLILTITLGGRHYFPHFTSQETEAQRFAQIQRRINKYQKMNLKPVYVISESMPFDLARGAFTLDACFTGLLLLQSEANLRPKGCAYPELVPLPRPCSCCQNPLLSSPEPTSKASS